MVDNIIDVIKVWIIVFILPLAVGMLFIMWGGCKNTLMNRRIDVHLAILVSIILCQIYLFERGINILSQLRISIVIFIIAIIVSILLIKSLGIFYALSSLLQELCLLSMATYIIAFWNVWMAIILVVPIFASTHMINRNHRWIKIIITFIWGVLSIYLFSLGINILIISSVHLLAGSILIHKKVLMARSNNKQY